MVFAAEIFNLFDAGFGYKLISNKLFLSMLAVAQSSPT
jgi:hypothetical protein